MSCDPVTRMTGSCSESPGPEGPRIDTRTVFSMAVRPEIDSNKEHSVVLGRFSIEQI